MDNGSDSSQTSSTENHPGCGCNSATNITIRVTPTTGGNFDLQVAKTESVESLKKLISKKLKVPKERICLLHRDRQLRDGTLHENQLMDGSRLTLLPSVETGLLAQRPEQSVMQALESLNDSQVNDFLSGKAPLNLTMRLGDHMMLIQLQLSTVTPSSTRRGGGTNSTSSIATATTTSSSSIAQPSPLSSLSSLARAATPARKVSSSFSPISSSKPLATSPTSSMSSSALPAAPSSYSSASSKPQLTSSGASLPSRHEPTTSTVQNSNSILAHSNVNSSSSCISSVRSSCGGLPNNSPTGPFGSGLCTKPLFCGVAAEKTSIGIPSVPLEKSAPTSLIQPATVSASSSSLSASKTTVSASAAAVAASACTSPSSATACADPAASTATACRFEPQVKSTPETRSPTTHACRCEPSIARPSLDPRNGTHGGRCEALGKPSSDPRNPTQACRCEPAVKPTLDTRALAEASRNLTQTLKQLSSEVLTSRADPAEDSARARRQGAIIESMHHHGKGVYSGTFSGTLNPALQDRFGRPKRDISTIIHILNDLLCATPQYRHHARQGHTITVEASTPQSQAPTGTDKTASSAVDFTDDPSSNLMRENQATRGKVEQLRLIMEERRAKRRARREARAAPYTTQWSAKSETLQQTTATEAMDTDSAELNPPGPVVA